MTLLLCSDELQDWTRARNNALLAKVWRIWSSSRFWLVIDAKIVVRLEIHDYFFRDNIELWKPRELKVREALHTIKHSPGTILKVFDHHRTVRTVCATLQSIQVRKETIYLSISGKKCDQIHWFFDWDEFFASNVKESVKRWTGNSSKSIRTVRT